LKFGSKILFCWICPEESKGKQKKWWPLNNTIVNTTRLVRGGSLEIIQKIFSQVKGVGPYRPVKRRRFVLSLEPLQFLKPAKSSPIAMNLAAPTSSFSTMILPSSKIYKICLNRQQPRQINLLLGFSLLSLMFLERRPFEFE
jgi:hypothetical protein